MGRLSAGEAAAASYRKKKMITKNGFAAMVVSVLLVIGLLPGCALADQAPNGNPDAGASGQSEMPGGSSDAGVSGQPETPAPTSNAEMPDQGSPADFKMPAPDAPTDSGTPALDAPTDSGTSTPDIPTNPIPTPLTEEEALEGLLQQMTLREKVGQLFLVRPDALDTSQTPDQMDDANAEGVTALTEAMEEMLQECPVGGIVMFRKNLVSPEQIAAFHKALQNASKIPLFLSVDEEGGSVARLANHPAFDLPKYASAAAVASEGNPDAALEMGSTIGGYLRQYGFNMDFAPDADVNTNPDNPVIGTRAFSSDAHIAAQMAAAMAKGLRQQGIAAVFKHFPGHGDTAEDSHKGIAVSYKTREEMEACEWLPFLETGSADCIMVGHIAVPEITGGLMPATMSHMVVTEILRGQLGFEGLILTDSLTMGAIIEEYSSGEAALNAFLAGCDILLMPYSLPEAFDAILAAAEDGTISGEYLDETVRRILRFKIENGILLIDK